MVRIAQVGVGYWGKNLVRNFAELGVLGAVVETDFDVAHSLSEAYDVPARSLHDVLVDPNIDGISLATPAETHAPLAIQALNAGKHVFLEKPLALTVSDGQAVLDAARVAQRTLMIGHLLQYHSCFRKLHAIVKSGELGTLRHLYSNRMSFGKFRLEENVWWSFAPHDISMVLALVGEEPSQVTAQGGAYVTPGIADWCTAQFSFPSGVGAHFNISWYHPFKEQRLVVIGDRGMAVFEDSRQEWEQKLIVYRHDLGADALGVPVPLRADAEFIKVEPSEPLAVECAHFIKCIRSAATPLTNGAESLAVLRALEMGERALDASLKG